MQIRISHFLVFLIIILSFKVWSLEKPKPKFTIFLYGGQYTETDLLPILFRQKTDYKDSFIATAGLSYPTGYRIRFINFETEGNLTKHSGIMNHWELNGLYVARINNLFSLPINFGFGEGLSLASEIPRLENKSKGIDRNGFYQRDSIESRNVLNYVMVELEYKINTTYDPRVFIRVHHRSGVFGLLCPPDPACGSNFITYGVKLSI
ncbi:MAG: hypothetical protein SFU98_01325 [Leptospiraceae bacterium]|nr:hypothetical protein [Leptospiraceae bacterium]